MTEKFIIGLAGAPFGVKGFLKVRPLSGETGHLLKLKSVIVSKDGTEQTLQIEESAPVGGAPAGATAGASAVLMRFAGIDSPEKAKDLTGAQLLVNRGQAAPLGKGEFYIEDLKGLAVISLADASGASEESGETIGRIADIIEGGGAELAEIELLNGERRFVPFRKEFFSEISPEKGRLVIQNLWILE
ncbi:MAG: ribosome maturation factor RimM [Treponema sp.]|nr:ribosome maturation factor RimM [Treponema sp.]